MNKIDIRDVEVASEITREKAAPLMALHCSGADGTQWRHLKESIGANAEIILPDLVGAEAAANGWTRTSYSLAEEARPLVTFLRSIPDPVHLVGHSYGGAVALHIARYHPELVASLCLYEPTLFSLLDNSRPDDQRLFAEIETLTASIEDAVREGCLDFAAQVFSDFWGGVGAWQALSRDRRAALASWIPKCPLDFGALLYEASVVPLPEDIPITLLVGTQSQRQTKRIADLLVAEAPQARLIEVHGAGHLGPFTFRTRVAELVGQHHEKAVL